MIPLMLHYTLVPSVRIASQNSPHFRTCMKTSLNQLSSHTKKEQLVRRVPIIDLICRYSKGVRQQ